MFNTILPLLEALNGRLGVIWDILHPYRFGEDMETTSKNLQPYLCHVHVKDSAQYSRERFDIALPGKGSIPVREAISLLKASGYDGYLCFEWEKFWHPEIPDSDIALSCFTNYMAQYMD